MRSFVLTTRSDLTLAESAILSYIAHLTKYRIDVQEGVLDYFPRATDKHLAEVTSLGIHAVKNALSSLVEKNCLARETNPVKKTAKGFCRERSFLVLDKEFIGVYKLEKILPFVGKYWEKNQVTPTHPTQWQKRVDIMNTAETKVDFWKACDKINETTCRNMWLVKVEASKKWKGFMFNKTDFKAFFKLYEGTLLSETMVKEFFSTATDFFTWAVDARDWFYEALKRKPGYTAPEAKEDYGS